MSILGVENCKLTGNQAIQAVDSLAAEGSCQMLAYVNAHTLNLAVRDDDLREALNHSALVMNDGFGPNLTARMRGEGSISAMRPAGARGDSRATLRGDLSTMRTLPTQRKNDSAGRSH